MEKYRKIFKEYAERMKKIRLLSTPDLSRIGDSSEYSRTLIANFSKIGEYAVENRKIINEFIKPLISSDERLSEEDKQRLSLFVELLVEDETFEEIDVHLSEFMNDLLVNDDIRIDDAIDDSTKVISMAKKVKRDYYMVSALTRYPNENAEIMRKYALKNRDMLETYLEKDMFEKLSDEAKGAALQFSLMGAMLYENNLVLMPMEYWKKCFDILSRGESILNDPLYRNAFPDYAWDVYEFRIYYYGSFMAYSLLPKEMALKAYDHAQKAIDFLKDCTNENILAAVDEKQEEDLLYLASVQAGITPAREACELFYKAYEERDRNDFSLTGINKNLDTPSSYLNIAKTMNLELNEEDYDRYYDIERSMLDYLYRIPKRSDSYLKCITLMTNLPLNFREVPNAMTMEDFCINAFAAVHPPTYTHINMVARISACMTKHLLEMDPSLFIGFPGCDSVEQVCAFKDRIIKYAYHAALCHDLGKLFIIDVISMYGRNLLDDEFSIIKDHPNIGADIALEHASTREYADVIRGHHIWYDCSRGYPMGFDTFKSPYKTVIDIVLAADCLDAATDSVGRSYNKGKVFGDYEKEVAEGCGTHYAPFLPGLFKMPALRSDIEYLLSEGRQKMYQETFRLITLNGSR